MIHVVTFIAGMIVGIVGLSVIAIVMSGDDDIIEDIDIGDWRMK